MVKGLRLILNGMFEHDRARLLNFGLIYRHEPGGAFQNSGPETESWGCGDQGDQ